MRILLAILIIIAVTLQCRIWFAKDGASSVWRLARENAALRKENNELEKHNAALIKDIEALKKGGDAIENRARNDLGMIKEGEVFYQVAK